MEVGRETVRQIGARHHRHALATGAGYFAHLFPDQYDALRSEPFEAAVEAMLAIYESEQAVGA